MSNSKEPSAIQIITEDFSPKVVELNDKREREE
jgi:hypothetical protein